MRGVPAEAIEILLVADAEDAAAGRVKADDAARRITATLVAAYTPPAEGRKA